MRTVLRLGLLCALATLAVAAGVRHDGMAGTDDGVDATAVATFAGGCFWCMEPPFEKLDGVARVVSGYSGGSEPDPTYDQVSSGKTGHAEAVQVHYDPERVGYDELLQVFWRQIDPTDAGGQFVDRGRQYRTAIFVHDAEQRRLAEASKAALAASGRYDAPLVTEIVDFEAFYLAEDYHQDYYERNPIRYRTYRYFSGRDQYLEKIWGAAAGKPDVAGKADGMSWSPEAFQQPSEEELKERLTSIQFEVTQRDATELPFRNAYWDNKKDGIYVDVVSGEPLFSSKDKFRSGTGWPSFTRPLEPENIVELEDRSLWDVRTEVRSLHADSHLGHVFPDGPEPTGLRYCINSAALRFIPVAELDREGYGRYRALFEARNAASD